MKFRAIVKASLASGMLATGVITSNIQPVQVETEVKQQSEVDLKLYYSGPSFEYKKVTGCGFIEGKDRLIDFIYNGQYSKIFLAGSNKDKYSEEANPDTDMFVVREGNGRQADNHSTGGVTKTDRGVYYNHIHSLTPEIKEGNEESRNSLYQIYKENISLKELDYRLRECVTKQHGLYSNGLKQGQTTITMKDGKSHTIGLSQKLEKKRMGGSIDGRQIQKILAEME